MQRINNSEEIEELKVQGIASHPRRSVRKKAGSARARQGHCPFPWTLRGVNELAHSPERASPLPYPNTLPAWVPQSEPHHRLLRHKQPSPL